MFLADTKRHAGSLLWVFGEQFMTMGVARFALFPIAAYVIGKGSFGVFITAFSVTAMLGATPSLGLGVGVLRRIAQYPADGQVQLCRTAIQMCHRVMVVVVALALVAIVVFGWLRAAPLALLACLILLVLSLYPENQFTLALTDLRVSRRFRERAAWHSLRSVFLFVAGLAGSLAGGAVGLASGLLLGRTAGYVAIRVRRAERWRPAYDPVMATALRKAWLHLTAASVLAFSGHHLNRILLSVWRPFDDVSDLFAATSVLFLFLVPLTTGSGFLLSMLAAHASLASLSRRIKVQYLVLSIVCTVGTPLVLRIAGPTILSLMFPAFGDASLRLFDIVFWASPCAVVALLAQPFVVKFAPIATVPAVNGLTLVGHVASAIVLVPMFGAVGAAWSFVIGYSIQGLSMLAVLIWSGRQRIRAPMVVSETLDG